jgi:hypothetical protein
MAQEMAHSPVPDHRGDESLSEIGRSDDFSQATTMSRLGNIAMP